MTTTQEHKWLKEKTDALRYQAFSIDFDNWYKNHTCGDKKSSSLEKITPKKTQVPDKKLTLKKSSSLIKNGILKNDLRQIEKGGVK